MEIIGILVVIYYFKALWDIVDSHENGLNFKDNANTELKFLVDFLNWFMDWRKHSLDRGNEAALVKWNLSETKRFDNANAIGSKSSMKDKQRKQHKGTFPSSEEYSFFLTKKTSDNIISNLICWVSLVLTYTNPDILNEALVAKVGSLGISNPANKSRLNNQSVNLKSIYGNFPISSSTKLYIALAKTNNPYVENAHADLRLAVGHGKLTASSVEYATNRLFAKKNG